MNDGNLNQVLTQGVDSSVLGDGLIWDSFSEDGIFVQAPRMGDEWRLEKALSIYPKLDAEDVPMPDILGYQESAPAYLAFEGLDGSTVKEIGKNIEDDADREEYLDYVRQAGEALARIHSADGEGYGNPDLGGWSVEGSHEDWPSYVEDNVEYIAEYTEGGRFEEIAQAGLEAINLDAIPEARNAVLHNDYTGDNLMVEENQVYVIDLDNAIYGDPMFGFVNAEESLCWNEESRKAFREGYETVREIEMSEELRKSYEALSLLDSAQGAEWTEIERDRDIEDWKGYLEERAINLN